LTIARRIGEHRPKIVCGTLVFLSLVSLASGTRGEAVGEGVRTAVGVVSMPFLVAMNRVEGGYVYLAGLVTSYGEMREATREMERDLAGLRLQISRDDEMRAENRRLRTMLSFQESAAKFSLIPAEIIQHANGILTIDRGSMHGVSDSMCVISPDGIVGIVTRAGPLTSNVVTLQSPDCKVDAMVKWNRLRGRVIGSGNDLSALCSMDYVDLKSEVRAGDEIVTSPDSIFPSGYPIGRVEGVPEEGQLSNSAAIMPAVDPLRLDEVFILFSASLDWKELANQMEGQEFLDEGSGLIDTETIQGRLAP